MFPCYFCVVPVINISLDWLGVMCAGARCVLLLSSTSKSITGDARHDAWGIRNNISVAIKYL